MTIYSVGGSPSSPRKLVLTDVPADKPFSRAAGPRGRCRRRAAAILGRRRRGDRRARASSLLSRLTASSHFLLACTSRSPRIMPTPWWKHQSQILRMALLTTPRYVSTYASARGSANCVTSGFSQARAGPDAGDCRLSSNQIANRSTSSVWPLSSCCCASLVPGVGRSCLQDLFGPAGCQPQRWRTAIPDIAID